jgi:hypothetical protein
MTRSQKRQAVGGSPVMVHPEIKVPDSQPWGGSAFEALASSRKDSAPMPMSQPQIDPKMLQDLLSRIAQPPQPDVSAQMQEMMKALREQAAENQALKARLAVAAEEKVEDSDEEDEMPQVAPRARGPKRNPAPRQGCAAMTRAGGACSFAAKAGCDGFCQRHYNIAQREEEDDQVEEQVRDRCHGAVANGGRRCALTKLMPLNLDGTVVPFMCHHHQFNKKTGAKMPLVYP